MIYDTSDTLMLVKNSQNYISKKMGTYTEALQEHVDLTIFKQSIKSDISIKIDGKTTTASMNSKSTSFTTLKAFDLH
jgi:hypothetical protein